MLKFYNMIFCRFQRKSKNSSFDNSFSVWQKSPLVAENFGQFYALKWDFMIETAFSRESFMVMGKLQMSLNQRVIKKNKNV